MEMDDFKLVQKHLKQQNRKEDKMKKIVFRLFNQILLTIILFLGTLILMKLNKDAKEVIYQNVYQKNFNFASTNQWYQKYLGSILPIFDWNTKETPVFQEKLTYQGANLYQDGAVLKVNENYMVPFLESGIVVFMGEKEEYGKTIIIQQVNGIDVWYGNVEAKDLKMYDYVEKGELLGETLSDQLFLVFQKEGKFLDYQDYIA